jgi:hypothetical protein
MRKREELRDDLVRLSREWRQWATRSPKFDAPFSEAAEACRPIPRRVEIPAPDPHWSEPLANSRRYLCIDGGAAFPPPARRHTLNARPRPRGRSKLSEANLAASK